MFASYKKATFNVNQLATFNVNQLFFVTLA